MATEAQIAALNAHYKGEYFPADRLSRLFVDKPDRWTFKKRTANEPHMPRLFIRNQWCKVVFTDLNRAESIFAHHWDEEHERIISPVPLIRQYADPHGVILCEGKCVVIVEDIDRDITKDVP